MAGRQAVARHSADPADASLARRIAPTPAYDNRDKQHPEGRHFDASRGVRSNPPRGEPEPRGLARR